MRLQKIHIVFLFFSILGLSQEKVTLSGVVSDANTNETLIGVSVFVPELNTGNYTNEYGFYSITVPKGNYTIQISYIGFETLREKIEINQNTKRNFSLKESKLELGEVVITENVYKTSIKKPEMSVNKLAISTIKQMPVLMGEVDIIKSLLFLPGVTNAGEGQSGFNVRGGGADQNLVLLDEATLYNTSHVFGFFSVFNADAIKDLKLYKGGIPARFGGRASAVLDVYQKDGNSNKLSMNGGIGLISSRLLAEGPIVKDKGSFLIAGRGSYAHLFLKLSDNQNSAYFYDLNTKLNYKLNENNNLYLSGYFGRDIFSLNESFRNVYGNSTMNLRWNHLFSNKLFSNLSLIYSNYYYGLDLGFIGFNWESTIENYNLKYDFKYYASEKTKFNFGANITKYDINPGTIKPLDDTSSINFRQLDKKYAVENGLYADVEHNLTDKISFMAGLRFSSFYRIGASNVNFYENNQPVVFDEELKIYEKATPIRTEYFGSNKKIADYSNFEPRFTISYQINENQSVKAGYNRMVQYMQLVSNTQSPSPLDVWTPSDNYIKPQLADQVSLGYFKNFKDGDYTLELETFYKKVQNRIDYIDGADLIANEAIEQVILNGKMRSYGLELLLRKNEGRLNGWVAYTLSRSEQQTPGRTPNETGINNGNWYRSAYDKTYNLTLTGNYKLDKRWTLGAAFTLQSGQPVTFPTGKYVFEGITVPSYNSRNEDRLPTYHRLDVSATLTPKKYENKRFKGEWVFGIYNLYSRNNAASISFRQNEDTGFNESVKLSIFGIVPSVSYNFKF